MAVSLPMADKSIKTVLNSGNCPRCFVGQCKTHPLQDHGQRTKQLTSGYKSSMQRMYDNLVNPTLKQLRDDAAQPSEQATRAYRERQEAEREKAGKRKRSKLSDEHARMAAETGLSGHVLAAMFKKGDGNDGSSGSDASSSEADGDDADARAAKKARKKELKKERKREKKEKKARKKEQKKERKREKKEKKKRDRDESGSSSSDDDAR